MSTSWKNDRGACRRGFVSLSLLKSLKRPQKPGLPPHHFNNSYISLRYVLFLEWEKQVAKAFFHSHLLWSLSNTLFICAEILRWHSLAFLRILLDSYSHFTFQWHKAGVVVGVLHLSPCLHPLHPLQLVIVRPPSVMAPQYWTVRRYRHCFRKVCKRRGMCQIVYNADVWSLWLHFTFWSKETFRNLGSNMECWEFFVGELKFFQNMFWPLFD